MLSNMARLDRWLDMALRIPPLFLPTGQKGPCNTSQKRGSWRNSSCHTDWRVPLFTPYRVDIPHQMPREDVVPELRCFSLQALQLAGW